MIKYEYNAINNPQFLGDRLLNRLGESGWELVSHAYNSNTCDHFYTFKRMKIEVIPSLSDEEIMEMNQKEYESPGWVDPMMEMLDKEEKESEWQRRRRLEVMKEASMNPNPVHYESREITVEDIHKIHREMMEKERTEEMERTYGVVIDEIKFSADFTGLDDNGNPTFRYKGVYYTLDKSFKKILEERIERPPHW